MPTKILCSFLSFFALIWLLGIFERTTQTYGSRGWFALLIGWFVAWIILEIFCAWRKQNLLPRVRIHLACAPAVVMIFALAFTFVFDQTLILHSKYQLRDYIYGNLPPEEKVSFDLHSDFRFGCGNAIPERYRGLYLDTASEGLSSSDFKIRARSLRATIEIYRYAVGFGGTDERFNQIISAAEQDTDEAVRSIAAQGRNIKDGF
ncbi:MAG TPA: hypothetical protein VF571_19415 [Pyrinomonadaceae bacterium]|jgi:hypothetical protein